jgi:hypothetical protein
MMARSTTTSSNQRPDTLMRDRVCRIEETSCNARPDHTFGSKREEPMSSISGPLLPRKRPLERTCRLVAFVPLADRRSPTRCPSPLRRRSAGSTVSSRTSRSQRGGSPNILRITLSASASKHRPWLSKICCGCHEWIFLIAASAFWRRRSSGSHMPKKI